MYFKYYINNDRFRYFGIKWSDFLGAKWNKMEFYGNMWFEVKKLLFLPFINVKSGIIQFMEEQTKRNEIEQLGKFNLINRLKENFKIHHTNTEVAVGDDAGVITFGTHKAVVASKQFLENIHFDLSYFPLKHLGYKCVGITISDILGMNAIPKQLTVNLAVSNRFSIEAVDELMTGIRACCQYYQIDLIGIDVTSSVTGLCISMAAVGEADAETLVKRTGCKENELICVSGDFGAAYTGLLLLQREKRIFEATQHSQPDFEGYEYLLERQLKPEPRLDIVQALHKNNIVPTAMTVVSDGLANALFHICNANDLGCTIFENKTPIDQLTFDTLRSLKIVATTVALHGGEDYELLFTIKQDDYEKIKNIENISVIGYMGEKNGGRYLISNDNCQIELKAQGFIQQEKEQN